MFTLDSNWYSPVSPLSATNDDAKTGARTSATLAYEAIRGGLLSGEVAAGQRLRIQELSACYGCGAIPVREALNRLAADGLVVHSEQRGFSAAGISAADVMDLCRARIWLSDAALAESVRRGDDAWEERVLIAYHRLQKVPRYESQEPPRSNPAYKEPHRVFHAALLSACGSSWALRLYAQLFDHAERHRNLARAISVSDPDAEHLALVQAALRHDVEGTQALARQHIEAVALTVAGRLQ